ncbi:MAG TPA: S53 family peptidase [Rhizomicrobium sp.]|jgi:subtilase family serine protease
MMLSRAKTIAAAMAAGFLCAGLGLTSAQAVAPPKAAFTSTAPLWIKQAQNAGPANSAQTVLISVHLPFRNMPALEALAKAVSTPGSSQYGHYLTPAQFRQRFAPLPADVASVRNALAKLGFSVGHSPASGAYIEATGTVGQIRSVFHVTQNLYRIHGQTLRATDRAATLPATLAGLVTSVSGLNDRRAIPDHIVEGATAQRIAAQPAVAKGASPMIQPEPWEFVYRPFCSTFWSGETTAVTPQPSPYASTLPWAPCGYTPQQMRAAYGITYQSLLSLSGTGVTIAIVDAYASPNLEGSANHYFSLHRVPQLTPANFRAIVPSGIYKVSASESCGPQGWFDEQTLDVEAAHSIAPGAHIVYIGSRDCNVSLDDALYDAIDNHTADVISNSYGYNGEEESGDEMVAGDTAFIEASTLGISVLFSSGDSGDVSQLNGIASASWPASSPFATAVGGTTLALHNLNGSKKEWGWGTYRSDPTGPATIANDGSTVSTTGFNGFTFDYGSGGGPSLNLPQPTYQQGIVPSSLSSFTYHSDGTQVALSQADRVTPDIAMDADPQTGLLIGEEFSVVTPGGDPGCTLNAGSTTLEYCEYVIGGTSLASPLFAGVLAIVTQQRFANSLPALGFVNPRLYGITPGVPSSKSAITDVVAPNNLTTMVRPVNFNTPFTPTVSLRTANSVPGREGADDLSLNTTTGYDNVTGLGTPWVPALLTALGTN